MKLVQIDWVDSCSAAAGHPWCHIDEVKPASVKCQSVGWLLHDDKESKTVIAHLSYGNHDGSLRQSAGDMTIPTRAITKLVVLRK